jgi:hypothetical protein
MSRQSADKKARRRERLASQNDRWIPDVTLESLTDAYSDDIGTAAELEHFDERITARGWTFDDEFSEDGLASWFYEPSGTTVADDRLEAVTRIWRSASDDEALAHLILVGTAEEHQFTLEAFSERLDEIEAYRLGS